MKYRLWVNDQRTVMIEMWESGEVPEQVVPAAL